MLQELQAAKKLSTWDTMVLAVLIVETAVSVPGLCQLESKKIIHLCDELLLLSYTLRKTLALRALRSLRILSVSNSRYYSSLGLAAECTLPATGVSSASRALAQRNFLGTKAWDINIAVQIKLQVVSKKGDDFTQGLRDYTALCEAVFKNLYLKSMNSSCLMREAPIHMAR